MLVVGKCFNSFPMLSLLEAVDVRVKIFWLIIDYPNVTDYKDKNKTKMTFILSQPAHQRQNFPSSTKKWRGTKLWDNFQPLNIQALQPLSLKVRYDRYEKQKKIDKKNKKKIDIKNKKR